LGFDGVIGVMGAVRLEFEECRPWLPAELIRLEVSKDFSFSMDFFRVFWDGRGLFEVGVGVFAVAAFAAVAFVGLSIVLDE